MDRHHRLSPVVRGRLPRPRGDGPVATSVAGVAESAPPPTRGWTFERAAHRDREAGSPAHAGMDLSRDCACRVTRWLPRPRGDGPVIQEKTARPLQAPPPTRGWTVFPRPPCRRPPGSPAHAGMDLSRRAPCSRRAGLPRPRGDGPHRAPSGRGCIPAPPPTRGWTLVAGDLPSGTFGSPAHAGMDPAGRGEQSARRWLPRPRGDGPSPSRRRRTTRAAPPPTRGWTSSRSRRTILPHGSPAHAGMDPSPTRPATASSRLPRPRGDGPASRPASRRERRAPPPTRGWTGVVGNQGDDDLGSPAHAGMDPTSSSLGAVVSRLPRPRGDGPLTLMEPPAGRGAPPPTRGWTPAPAPGRRMPRGSPAHAGMDPCPGDWLDRRRWLPRPRGDGPVSVCAAAVLGAAPPPTRGWTFDRECEPALNDGSPAHAGMDRIGLVTMGDRVLDGMGIPSHARGVTRDSVSARPGSRSPLARFAAAAGGGRDDGLHPDYASGPLIRRPLLRLAPVCGGCSWSTRFGRF